MVDPVPTHPSRIHWLPRRWWFLWVILVLNSLAWEDQFGPGPDWRSDDARPHEPSLCVPAMDDHGPRRSTNLNSIAYRIWPVQAGALGPYATPKPVPVLLIHGSPGAATDFDRLARPLRDAGYRVIAIDRSEERRVGKEC